MSNYNVESRSDPMLIGSPESDMEFVRDRNGKKTDVIRFKPGRRPPSPDLDQGWLAMEPALSVEPRGETNQGDEVSESARFLQDAELEAVLL